MTIRQPIVLDTPAQIEFARFAIIKGMLKLESKGFKTRGGSLRPRLCQEFCLKPRDGYDKYLQICVEKMTEQYVAAHGEAPNPPFTA
jgi:hypothetical protein